MLLRIFFSSRHGISILKRLFLHRLPISREDWFGTIPFIYNYFSGTKGSYINERGGFRT
jgi:hypothetical protein